MNWRVLLPFLGLLSWVAMADDTTSAPTGLQDNVVFSRYADLSGSAELLRRLVSPLNARRLRQQASGAGLREQAIDLAQERFALYVPAQPPPAGYAVLVFVPPWHKAKVPPAWTATLDRHGVILVTAANAGNDANPLDRREPLALLAAINVMARYRVDPQRIYIGGFSGGSRVALRLAIGYPDLFRGVLLNAGSDTVGDTIPLPPEPLMARFQEGTRLVFVTGERDTPRQDADRQSRQSLRDACVTDIDTLSMAWTGHQLADASSLDRALISLDKHRNDDAAALAACRARIEHDLAAQLDKAEALLNGGKTDDALRLLQAIDTRYGGLAAPRSVALAERLLALPAGDAGTPPH
ncbi:PHB depolymerase family esterase [Dyella silvae]|uniref:PHB depolymerase family esterase n=1 Tax=Dyella silvae TaxID=2994424 RepID=UPI002264BE31|nr:PHB depolymerase family esterase [Dyella silvae]